MSLSKTDLEQFKKHGLTPEKIDQQLKIFSEGIPFVKIVKAGSIGDGIVSISEADQNRLVEFYELNNQKKEIVKFVPASGAATRMFQFLFMFLNEFNPNGTSFETYINKKENKLLETFIKSLKDFAFFSSVQKKTKELYPDFEKASEGAGTYLFIKTMLDDKGLNFRNLPKGMIPFHKYETRTKTAFEEHLYESVYYASVNNNVKLHFTIAKKHLPFFEKELDGIKNRVLKKTKTKFQVSYSFQKKETDTIAVNNDNTVFKNAKNECVFRPSGHGALIENLNDLDADIVFIKNIDNVVSAKDVDEVAHHKKVLGGKLLWIQKKVFSYLVMLDKKNASLEKLHEIKTFLRNELNVRESIMTAAAIKNILNRPIRVCGVVKNTGAPGGGPFWVQNNNTLPTLQIVEMSQIDSNNSDHQTIVNSATHFNPVDLVCGLKNYKGNKFDLLKFVDSKSGIITDKSQDGRSLKALELPGLWNGSMAYWNSVFVEVPLKTFNPVKTVNDLLHEAHRSS
ncbi:MAG: DUF4301 family protein [Flavobacteriaceae bacterium]|nr:DUF4301 family protein [Flavobacteriaceae bacterium]